jgi:hypothetical protein
MLRWAMVLLLVAATPMARAERPVSITQFEQLLTPLHGQTDRKAAKQLSGLTLTERATSARLARWESSFAGKRCHEKLTELADASAFLDPPGDDFAADPPPAMAAQRDMLLKAIDATLNVIHRLPNFYATRLTERFEDAPPLVATIRGGMPTSGRGGRGGNVASITSEEPEKVPMYLASTTHTIVRYYDGHEMQGNKVADADTTQALSSELRTSGEFGPILTMSLTEAIRNTIQWARWQKTANEVHGVFSYHVPAKNSHFLVALPEGQKIERQLPAYHGEIEIDPATGSVTRISVIGEMEPPYQTAMSAIQVEYGIVNIGGKDYMCPVKSVALAKLPLGQSGQDKQDPNALLRTELNDVQFTDYHLFRSESRVITDIPEENGQAHPK